MRRLAVLLFATALHAPADLRILTWPTAHAAAPVSLPETQASLLPWIRLGVESVPEPTLMQMAFVGGSALGLPPEAAAELQREIGQRYQDLAKDPIFAKAPSLLPHAYAAAKPTEGRAFLIVPDQVGPDTRVIVFLHGYGGPFQLYPYYLRQSFPDAVILCPSYGISASHVPSEYLREALQAAAREVGSPLAKPVLIGLSAGGFGAFREYARHPERYQGMICLAAYPPGDMAMTDKGRQNIRLLAGADEIFVKDQTLANSVRHHALHAPGFQGELLDGQNHFFLLTAEERTRKVLERWVKEWTP